MPGSRSALGAFVRAMRPRQWAKNVLVYVPLVFSANQRWDPSRPREALELAGVATAAFLIFCLLSSATYLVNDVLDAPRDRAHPRKRLRPIAAGRVSPGAATAAAAVMAAAGLALAFLLGPWFGVAALAYLVVSTGYSAALKRVPVVDVLVLSGGYLLRAVAGAVVIGVPISPWLYVVISLGAMLIGFGKRRNELALTPDDGLAARQREALQGYSVQVLDQFIGVVATATLVSYTLYTFTAENLPPSHAMMLTIPFVVYGLFRYLLLVYHHNLGEAPEDVLLTDPPILATVLAWAIASAAVLVLAGPG